MKLIANLQTLLLDICLVVLAVSLLLTLIRAMMGPRFTDRILSVNMMSTQTIMIICILAFLIGEHYLVDVALVYAMTSFLAVIVLVNIFQTRSRKRQMKDAAEGAGSAAERMQAASTDAAKEVAEENTGSAAEDVQANAKTAEKPAAEAYTAAVQPQKEETT